MNANHKITKVKTKGKLYLPQNSSKKPSLCQNANTTPLKNQRIAYENKSWSIQLKTILFFTKQKPARIQKEF